jgi:hypothetical protein
MSNDFVVNKQLWVPERTFGVCIWIMPDGDPLSDGDGYLSAEGFVGDEAIEKRVAEAAKYWTGSTEGRVAWVHGARKVTESELDDQKARLADGYTPDPYEDAIEAAVRGMK